MAANPIAEGNGRIVIYRPDWIQCNTAKFDVLISGAIATSLANESVFYKDVTPDEYDIQILRPSEEMVKVKVRTTETIYIKIYASARTHWAGIWNMEQIDQKRAINEIKVLGESEAASLKDPETINLGK